MGLDGLGSALAALGTFAGVWAVVILFRWFQRDFASVYRSELAELRSRVDELEHEVGSEQALRRVAEQRIARLETELIRKGIPLPGPD